MAVVWGDGFQAAGDSDIDAEFVVGQVSIFSVSRNSRSVSK